MLLRQDNREEVFLNSYVSRHSRTFCWLAL